MTVSASTPILDDFNMGDAPRIIEQKINVADSTIQSLTVTRHRIMTTTFIGHGVIFALRASGGIAGREDNVRSTETAIAELHRNTQSVPIRTPSRGVGVAG